MMVWPFNKSDDPLANLDPELRKFLEKEAPKAQSNPAQATKATTAVNQSQQLKQFPNSRPTESSIPRVPPQSQFQDGRYAHLWKTYTPGVETEALSDGEVLKNLTKSFQWRKQEIGKVALENCAFEALAEQDCWKRGSIGQKLWLCRDETQALDRCTTLQAKFLQALGYMSVEDRPPEVEERIQMHADKLYQQMLEHEKITKEAKAQGLPAPEFKPIMSRDNLAKVLGVDAKPYTAIAERAEEMAKKTDLSYVPENMREKYEKNIKDMTPDERLIEEALNVAQAREQSNLARDYRQFVDKKKIEEVERKEAGAATLAERIRSWWPPKEEK
jgi:hypothetical protein